MDAVKDQPDLEDNTSHRDSKVYVIVTVDHSVYQRAIEVVNNLRLKEDLHRIVLS